MITRSLKRQRPRSNRLDLAPLKDILRDTRCWCAVGVVTVPDGESSHYEIVDGDVLVDVLTQPGERDLTCRMGGAAQGRGVIWIPREGDEVAVLIPEGEVDFMPVIVAVLSSGSAPDGVAEDTIVIADAKVLIHDGSGGAKPLATKDDIDALESAVSGHIHTTTATVGSEATPGVITPPTVPMPSASGTSVLEAK